MSLMRLKRRTEQAQLDMTPMLDIVFIMLIFFIVSTSFVKPAGITVDPPSAQSAVTQSRGTILVAISDTGEVWVDNRPVDVRSLRAVVARLHSENPEGTVVIQSDQDARTQVLVQVLDQVKLAGISNIAIAATAAQ